jgi:hypothetical protein
MHKKENYKHVGDYVTMAGECFSAFVDVRHSLLPTNYSGEYLSFFLEDRKSNTKAGEVVVYFGATESSFGDADFQTQSASFISCVNRIRRAFDSHRLDFDGKDSSEEGVR